MQDASDSRRVFCLRAGASLLAGAPRPGRAEPARPLSADAFVESIGVNVHLGSPPYDGQFGAVAARLAALGVRHVRDELRPGQQLSRWREAHAKSGIRLHLLVSPTTNTVGELLDYLGALGVEKVSAIEGQNEGDSEWFRAQPSARQGWAKAVVSYQRDLFTAVRRRYPQASLPILSPTLLDYAPADVRLIKAAAPFCDMVAVHAYAQGGQEPETEEDYAGLGWYLRAFRDPFKAGAVMMTEAGYATGNTGIPAATAGKYLPRLLLHAFSLGITRTFLYELMDEGTDPADSEQNYGLLASDAAPKPAFHSLQRLIHALADPGPPFVPARLEIQVRSSAPDLRAMAFRKRTGEVTLALWRACRSWDPATRRTLPAEPVQARLLFRRTFRGAATLALDSAQDWVALPRPGDTLDLAVIDSPTLLRLTA